MAKLNSRYGSELHLLRYMGRHRILLNKTILITIGVNGEIAWLDFEFEAKRKPGVLPDSEWKGLDFLDDRNILAAWKKYWPQSGNVQNWDAVGQLTIGGRKEWLLVEAKAHVEELQSHCGAKSPDGRTRIQRALSETVTVHGGHPPFR